MREGVVLTAWRLAGRSAREEGGVKPVTFPRLSPNPEEVKNTRKSHWDHWLGPL